MRIIALLAGAVLALASPCPAAPAANAEKTFSALEVRAEFNKLYELLQDSHADLYARRPKEQFDALYERMRKGFDRPLHLSEIQQEFQRFVAYGRVAHARIDAASAAYEHYRADGGKAIPLHIRVSKGRTYVALNLSGNDGIAAGDELTALDGRPLRELLQLLARHVSADNDYMRDALFEHRFPGLVWQVLGPKHSFRVRVAKSGGSESTIEIPALSRSEAEAALMKQPARFELSWDKREARMLDEQVAYLRPGPFYNNEEGATDPWDNRAFLRFIDNAFASFDQAGATKLLIDLRDNPGGDNSFSDAMVAWFADKPFKFCSEFRIKVSRATIESNAKRLPQSPPDSISHRFAAAYEAHKPGDDFSFEVPSVLPRKGQRFGGKVFMLINRHSYSNTVTVAALAQDYGFARILGEETSDLATTYGAMEQFTLPRTGITVGFPKAHIIRPSGDLKARGVVPDLAIDSPIVVTDQDVVLQQALATLRR